MRGEGFVEELGFHGVRARAGVLRDGEGAGCFEDEAVEGVGEAEEKGEVADGFGGAGEEAEVGDEGFVVAVGGEGIVALHVRCE